MVSSHILIVDDDNGIRDLLKGLLEEEGYTVATARNGREALDFLAQHASLGPHVILLDLMMPLLDGYAVMQELANNPLLRNSHAVVVMSAAHRLSGQQFELAHALLPKPFTIDEVLETVSRLTHQITHPQEEKGAHPTTEP